MADTVFIFGAGTSAGAGGPMMSNFLNAIDDTKNLDEARKYRDDFNLVMNAYKKLISANSRINMGYENNIEDLFASFELIRLLELPGFDDITNKDFISSIRKVIGCVIENKIKFFEGAELIDNKLNKYFLPQKYFEYFFTVINTAIQTGKTKPSDYCIISFNYDIVVDYAMTFLGIPYSYCLGNFERNYEKNGIPYLKMHGSLNWGLCKNCQTIIPYSLDDFIDMHPIEESNSNNFFLTKHLVDLKHCDQYFDNEPYLIPPIWNKYQQQILMQRIWRKAFVELQKARNIFICGYSMPKTDPFFRHLLGIALSNGEVIHNICNINPDETQLTEFKNLLGVSIINRYKEIAKNFESSIEDIARILKINHYFPDDFGGSRF
jgi:hypothetical protein